MIAAVKGLRLLQVLLLTSKRTGGGEEEEEEDGEEDGKGKESEPSSLRVSKIIH